MKRIVFVVLLIVFQSITLFSQVLTNLDFDVNYKQLVNDLKSKNYVQVYENDNAVLLRGVTLSKIVDISILFAQRTGNVLSLSILFEPFTNKDEKIIFYNELFQIYSKAYGKPKKLYNRFSSIFDSYTWKKDNIMITLSSFERIVISYSTTNRKAYK